MYLRCLTAEFYDWGLRSGLYTSATASDLADTRMGYLAYWLAPRASQPVLWLIGTFNLWVIAVDDSMAEAGAPLDTLARACDDVIRHDETSMALTPPSRFFIELREQIIGLGGAGLLPQIADQVAYSFREWKREQRYIREDCLPSLPGYLHLRVGTPCLYGPMLAQRCEKGLLPPHLRFDERLDKIAQLVNVIVSLNGDILGYRRDLESSFFPMNVICVIALAFDVDIVTAYCMSLDLTDLYKHMFDALVASVYVNPGRHLETAEQAKALAQWLDGFHTWHMTSPRHENDQPLMDAEAAKGHFPDWPSGPLWHAVSGRAVHARAPRSPTEKRVLIGPTGLGTSAARLGTPRDANAAKRLEDWAAGLLGWHARSSHDTGNGAHDVPAAGRSPGVPTGLGTSAVRIHTRSRG